MKQRLLPALRLYLQARLEALLEAAGISRLTGTWQNTVTFSTVSFLVLRRNVNFLVPGAKLIFLFLGESKQLADPDVLKRLTSSVRYHKTTAYHNVIYRWLSKFHSTVSKQNGSHLNYSSSWLPVYFFYVSGVIWVNLRLWFWSFCRALFIWLHFVVFERHGVQAGQLKMQ